MRIRDDDTRCTVVDAIESETPYRVLIEDRVGDVHIYDPKTVDP